IDPLSTRSQNFLPEHKPCKKKYDTEYHQGNASFGMSVFNLGNAIMGSGILGLSYAMANTGIILFIFLLVAVAIFSLYSVHLLLKTANEGGALVYEQLGYKAFGIPGKLAASCSITMQNIGAMSSYLYIVKYEFPLVIQAFTGANDEWYTNGNYLVLLVSLFIILPLSLLRNLGYLGYTSGLSLLCMVFFLIVVIIKKFQIPCPLPDDLDAVNETLSKALNMSFDANTTTPLHYDEDMCNEHHPDSFPDNNSQVGPELLHTYSRFYKSDVLLLIVRLAVLTAVTLTVPVVLFPIRTSINHLLCPAKGFSWIRHCIITFVLLASTNALVIFVPTIRDIFGFIGASAAAMLIFILPSAFYIKLVEKESMKSVQKIGATIFLICGIIVMVGSITLIVLDWIHSSH
uniref:Sodium-coupled neutral amino acid symporter 2 n=1 Tax=Gouania willdenowi TaxID=441366 RepID=A0A8C5H9A5_GOUWI